MHFSVLKSAVVALAVCNGAVLGKATPDDIYNGINELQNHAIDIRIVAGTITAVNGPLITSGEGPFPQIIKGFEGLITATMALTQQTRDVAQKINTGDVEQISRAFEKFAIEQEWLLKTLGDKAGLFKAMPSIGKPVVDVLERFREAFDDLDYNLKTFIVDGSSNNVHLAYEMVSYALQKTISKYKGISLTERSLNRGTSSRLD